VERARPIFSRAAEHVRKNASREAEAQAENRASMTPAERYETEVMRRTFGLLNTVGALADARRLISVFPSKLGKGAQSISRDRWVDYHYGYFTVSLASLPDIGVVLTATVCQLGLALKHCRADVVVSHASVRSTPIAAALRELGKSVQPGKERRHGHVHRGDLAEIDSLSDDTFLRDLKTITFIRSLDPSFIDSSILRGAWREASKTILARLDAEKGLAEEAIGNLFDALLPQFTSRSAVLRQLMGKFRPARV